MVGFLDEEGEDDDGSGGGSEEVVAFMKNLLKRKIDNQSTHAHLSLVRKRKERRELAGVFLSIVRSQYLLNIRG